MMDLLKCSSCSFVYLDLSGRRSPARADRETRNGGRATPLKKAFVLTNYYVGRVGGLGDKLEVYVLKG